MQEEGWPLGLHPLNVRVGLVRNRDINGSLSFNTLITRSPSSSTDSSSDLDTQVCLMISQSINCLLILFDCAQESRKRGGERGKKKKEIFIFIILINLQCKCESFLLLHSQFCLNSPIRSNYAADNHKDESFFISFFILQFKEELCLWLTFFCHSLSASF